LDWRRLRRAEARVTRAAADVAAHTTRPAAPRRSRRAKRLPAVDAMPAPADLAAIEAEWPLIAAEIRTA
jgi:hypothetical protein